MKTMSLRYSWVALLIVAGSGPATKSVVLGIDEPVSPPVSQSFLLTQEILDAVTTIIAPADSAITGNGFGVRTDGSDRNIKDIYTNKPLNRSIQVGDVIVIRSFQNENGRRGPLDFVNLMVLRETGFNPSGRDFDYFRIDFDAAINYTQHPNGRVPTLDNSRDWGVDIARAGCINCHRFAGDGDFLFTTR